MAYGVGGMRVVGFLSIAAVCAVAMTSANAETCQRAEFEAVVDQASATLVEVAQKNAPQFQSRLRALKDKRGWTNEQLMTGGATFVRDDTISSFDEKSEQLLITINSQASDGADCKSLAELKLAMASLVETQTAKWAYMFDKIDKELAK